MSKVKNMFNSLIKESNGSYIEKNSNRPSIKLILPNIVKNIKKDTIVTDSNS